LELLLKLEADMEVVGLARDGAEALDLMAKRASDLVLMEMCFAHFGTCN
jgi:DNA-binding NarL/FixJ family response regulator